MLEQNTMATPWRFPQKNHLNREAEEESAKKNGDHRSAGWI
jgi:hypothetical protein